MTDGSSTPIREGTRGKKIVLWGVIGVLVLVILVGATALVLGREQVVEARPPPAAAIAQPPTP